MCFPRWGSVIIIGQAYEYHWLCVDSLHGVSRLARVEPNWRASGASRLRRHSACDLTGRKCHCGFVARFYLPDAAGWWNADPAESHRRNGYRSGLVAGREADRFHQLVAGAESGPGSSDRSGGWFTGYSPQGDLGARTVAISSGWKTAARGFFRE